MTAHRDEAMCEESTVADGAWRRVNLGSGKSAASGWLNVDWGDYSGVDVVADMVAGMPFRSDAFEAVVLVHALPEVRYDDVVGVLDEIRRILRPGGVVRLCLPDLAKGIAAWQRGDHGHFLVPDDDESTVGGKFVVQMLWYGSSKLLFVSDFALDLLRRAGFDPVSEMQFGETSNGRPWTADLDNRPEESLFVEGVKPEMCEVR